MRPLLNRLLFATLLASSACASDAAPATGCNGHDALCDRAYDEVAYATTHNAMATEVDGFLPPNQVNSMTQQLDDGVRGLMLDLYYHHRTDVPSLCHGSCVLGSRDLTDGLREINDWLDANPREVLTFILESYIDAADFEAAMRDVGMLSRVVPHTAGEPWPTLRELIDADTRVVVLTDREGGAFPGYLDVWAEAWEVPFAANRADDFTCSAGRGNTANALWIFNHFLTAPLASPDLAEMVNHDPLLGDRVAMCQTEANDFPNFITLDFYEIGDIFAVTDRLNGVE